MPGTAVRSGSSADGPAAGLFPRPRVDALLDEAQRSQVVEVVAAAGYGKTTAVAEWLRRRGRHAAWIAVDEADNDPVRLWSRITVALADLRVDTRAAAARLRGPSGDVVPAIDALAAALTRDGREIAIVLDDAHLIDEPSCRAAFDHGVRTLPASCRLVVVTRRPWVRRAARLRTQGRYERLTDAGLVFDRAEVHRLLVDGQALELDDRQVARIAERTEGWPAIVVLAGLSLRDHGDVDAAIAALGTTSAELSDYLAAEVLAGMAPTDRAFLLRSAPLTTLAGTVCDAVLEASGSAERLERLAATIPLIRPTGPHGTYRCHALLRSHLTATLEAHEPEIAATIRRRAFAWYLRHDMHDDAVACAAAAGDHAAVCDLAAEHHNTLLRQGRGETLHRWTSAIPLAQQHEHPLATIAALFAGHTVARPPADVRRLIAALENTRAQRPAAWTPYCAAALHLASAIYALDAATAVAQGKLAVAAAEEADELATIAGSALALAQLLAGQADEAATTAQATIHHPLAAQRTVGLISASSTLAIVEAQDGRERAAAQTLAAARAIARDAGIAMGRLAAGVELADAVLALRAGRLFAADRAARNAVAWVLPGGLHEALAQVVLADVSVRLGRGVAAERALGAAEEIVAVAQDRGPVAVLGSTLRARMADGATPPEVPSISPAQHAVLVLLPLDLTTRQMAERLYLSTNTIKSHLRSIFRALGVENRAGAVATAARLGLLDDGGSPG